MKKLILSSLLIVGLVPTFATAQTPPVAKCKNILVSADANCQGVGSVDDGSFDPDQGDSITVVQAPPGPYPLGTNNVTLCVTDSQGASNCCNATVTVVDATPPDIRCPNNILASPDPGQSSAVVKYTVSAIDNCGGCTLLSDDFNVSDGGFTVVNVNGPFEGPWTYNGTNGNWFSDGQGPELGRAPSTRLNSPSVDVSCGRSVRLTLVHRFSFQFDGTAWDGGQVRVSVNGGPYTTVPGDAFTRNGYNGTVASFSSSELAGQRAFIRNSQGYAVANITSEADLGVFAAGDTISVQFLAAYNNNTRSSRPAWGIDSVSLTAGSGNSPVPVVCDPPSGSAFPIGATPVLCTASDAAGNTNSCTFDVNVTRPPVAKCKNIVVPADANCRAAGSVDDGSFDPDQGDSITLVQTPPGPYPLGTNNVTLCATDNHGASNCCNATVTVVDTTPPDILCPTNIVVHAEPGQCSAVVTYAVTATDNCVDCAPLSEDFTTGDGRFTVVTPQPFNTPWTYNAGVGSWQVVQDAAEVGHPMTSRLDSPAIHLTCAGRVLLTFIHRFSFEFDGTRWDGGQVRISVNGGPYATVPVAAFSQNGYNGTVSAGSLSVLHGQPAFVETSPDHAGPAYIISVADLGVLSAGDTISVEFLYAGDTNTRGPLTPNWEITSVALDVGNFSGPVPVACDPPSGSTFPKGITPVLCTAVDAAGNTNTCIFGVIVEDHEAPLADCRPGVNPSGRRIPMAGKLPAGGQNPDGFYELLAKDNCDGNPWIYLADKGSAFIAGPFRSGAVIKLTQSPGREPGQEPAPAPIVAHVHLRGDGLLFAVDADGNKSEAHLCLVLRPPK